MDSVTKVAWYNDYCGVSACLTAVVLFSYCWPIANFFSSKVFSRVVHFHKNIVGITSDVK